MNAAAIAHATPNGYTGTPYRLILAEQPESLREKEKDPSNGAFFYGHDTGRRIVLVIVSLVPVRRRGYEILVRVRP